ncbi:YeeE/YedE family protein [Rhodobacteraceae bacterium M382]|nr:YeeE/YedE family protein [Rhodobacteraceae bacterium M382]
MFETFGFEDTTAREVSVLFALGLGLLFGLLAQITRFCFRRAIVGDDRKQAAGVWFMALALAVVGTQAAAHVGWISFDSHRLMSSDLPVLAILAGGLLFGGGMVLTRGCISRLTVLSGAGNLRALTCVVVFAIAAHATLKGVLAPLAATLRQTTVDLGGTVSLAALPGGAVIWSAILVALAIFIAVRSGARPALLLGAGLIGALVPLGWVGTGFILFDEFDPIAMESLSFTRPSADALFYTIASTSIPAGFGSALIGGVLIGGLVAALLTRQFRWQSFDSPRQTGRYLAGASLMGVGGVLAGGCTVGAGLAGIPTLSFAAFLALAAIAAGGWGTAKLLNAAFDGSDGSPARPDLQPAE